MYTQPYPLQQSVADSSPPHRYVNPVIPTTTISIRLLHTSQVCTPSHTHYNNQHQTPAHLTGMYTQPYPLQQSVADSSPPHRYVNPVIPATTISIRLLPTSQACAPSHTHYNNQHQTPSHLTGLYIQPYPLQQSASGSFPPHRFVHPAIPATTISIRFLPTSQVCTPSHTHYNSQHQTPSHLTGLYTQPYPLQQSVSDSSLPHRYVHLAIPTTTASIRLLPTSQVCTPSHTCHNSQYQTPPHLTGMYIQSYLLQQSASGSCPPHRFVHPAIPATTISIRVHLTGMYIQPYPLQQSASGSSPPHRYEHPVIRATTVSIRLLPTSQVCTPSNTSASDSSADWPCMLCVL